MVGGYNEYFSGSYGYDDIDWFYRLVAVLRVGRLDVTLMVTTGEFITRGLDRDLTPNQEKMANTNKPHLTFCHSDTYARLM